MYLTRAAGIETIDRSLNELEILMYLTRAAGIETKEILLLSIIMNDVSYPRRGN